MATAEGQSGDASELVSAVQQTDVKDWIAGTRDVAQIGFFVTVAAVTVLTYRRARATLLQPIRTEVFKEQVKLLGSLQEMLVAKGEVELLSDFGLDELFTANSVLMYDNYASTLFNRKVDATTRPYHTDKCPGAVVTESYLEKFAVPLDQPFDVDSPPYLPSEGLDRDGRLKLWADYEHGSVCVPRQFSVQKAKLDKLIASPLVPTELVKLLRSFESLLNENITITSSLLTESAAKMPHHYPDLQCMTNASLGWLHTSWVSKLKPLEPIANEICTFVRRYFHTDTFVIDDRKR
jgi:hypothetical protein